LGKNHQSDEEKEVDSSDFEGAIRGETGTGTEMGKVNEKGEKERLPCRGEHSRGG